MASLIYSEFLKLKRSKIFIISVLGGLVAPLIEIISVVKGRTEITDFTPIFSTMFMDVNLYNMMLFGMVVFCVIIGYLFSREYTENTLKNIVTIPVSKVKFLLAKFIMLYFWIFALVLLAWLMTFLGGLILGVGELSAAVLLKSLWDFFLGTTLVFITLTPFVLITLVFKNIIPTIIAAVAIALGNIVLLSDEFAKIYPWSASFYIMNYSDKPFPEIYQSITAVALVGIIGFIGSLIYFKRQDIK